MNLIIARISTDIAEDAFQSTVAAIQNQVNSDLNPEWGVSATLAPETLDLKNHRAPIQNKQDAIIYLGSSHQDPTTGVSGALGYHSENFSNIPYGFVYTDIAAEYGEEWSVTLSHEVLELLIDPTAVKKINGPAPRNRAGRVDYDEEVCDPCQGDSYKVGNIPVSNFVGRAYFGLVGGSGNTNKMKLPLDPFGVRHGGYFQYSDGYNTYQIQGDKIDKKMLAAKEKIDRVRRLTRRRNLLTISARDNLSVPVDSRQRVLQAALEAAIAEVKRSSTGSQKPAVQMDTVGDVAAIATGVAQIVSVTGF